MDEVTFEDHEMLAEVLERGLPELTCFKCLARQNHASEETLLMPWLPILFP